MLLDTSPGALARDVLEAARGMLANAGSPAESDSDAVVAMFNIGLGVVSGHYSEFLAMRRDAGMDGGDADAARRRSDTLSTDHR